MAQRKFVGHAVSVETGTGVDFRSAFEHDDVDAEVRQVAESVPPAAPEPTTQTS
jgi:hypothetical protein